MSRRPVVLNVAEKNSVSREVSRLLSRGGMREENSCAQFCKIYKFPFRLQGRDVDMIFSSVMGHLLELEFSPPYSGWNSCHPGDLYNAPVSKQVKGHNEQVQRNLQQLARQAQQLVLWLDCDREGENIAFEVIKVCTEANPRLQIFRARFSALIERDLLHAVNNLIPPNANEAAAVDVRQEIDLRIGASFTRLQTLLLQKKFNWGPYLQDGRENMLFSYGPCQFPTLGLMVQREWEIQAHVSEEFWYLVVRFRSGSQGCEFSWKRGRAYDEISVKRYHVKVLANPIATVTSVDGRERTRFAPAPLSTLEMQKKASGSLRISGERIMKLAEELYQGGFISYPRTETDVFAPNYDLMGLVTTQAQANAPWSAFAQGLVGGGFRWPRAGGHDDKAHPPIHPTKAYQGDGGEKARLYEFIARHFLACCAHDAKGQETTVCIEISQEEFSVNGLMVTHRNWLDVYPYTNWGGHEALPPFIQGQTFQPLSIDLKHGATQPPSRMKESDLLSKMDAYGIGTDATVADHIAKQISRGYAEKDEVNLTFAPTPLGEALISAYRKMGLQNLWMPTLRGIIEQNISAVARGQRPKEEVLQEALDAFKGDFASAFARAGILEDEVRQIVFNGGGAAAAAPGMNQNGNGGGGPGGGDGGQEFGVCKVCGGGHLNLSRNHGTNSFMVECSSHPLCQYRKIMPRCAQSIEISDQQCSTCTHGQVFKLKFSFNRPLLPPQFQYMAQTTTCLVCDRQLDGLLAAVGPAHHTAAPRRHNQQVQRGGVQAHRGSQQRGRGQGQGRAAGRARGGGRASSGRGAGRGGRSYRGGRRGGQNANR